MKYYYPYKSDKPEKKYFIMTKTGKHIYFGAAGMSDLRNIKTRIEKIDILIGTSIMKIGVNLE